MSNDFEIIRSCCHGQRRRWRCKPRLDVEMARNYPKMKDVGTEIVSKSEE